MSKITIGQIEAAIASEHYFTAADGREGAIEAGTYVGREQPAEDDADLEPLEALTFCVMVLQNGFLVHGSSKFADPTEFNPEIGRKLARADAIRQIWPLMGFALCDELVKEEEILAELHEQEQAHLASLGSTAPCGACAGCQGERDDEQVSTALIAATLLHNVMFGSNQRRR